MLEKLAEIEHRYNELTEKLSLPDIIQDLKSFRELSREHSHLKKLVETYQEYKKTARDLEGNLDLLKTEKDPDMAKLAREELAPLEQKKLQL